MADLSKGKPIGPEVLTGRQVYNLVVDTVTGPNIRLKDNMVQALVIVACLLVGMTVGSLVETEQVPGALLGAFLGVSIGLLVSGLFLMVYRAWLHIRGKHD
jgi:hypothetical protein